MIRPSLGLTLLIGGARSGKSDLVVRLGEAWSGGITFVATATAGDSDMADRIARHRQDRPSTWAVVEKAGFAASDVSDIDGDHLLIIDCLTLLTANLVFADNDEAQVLGHTRELAARVAVRPGPTLVVTNEVGLGIHPDNALARSYRDVHGLVNRAFADAAALTLFVVAGKVARLDDMEVAW